MRKVATTDMRQILLWLALPALTQASANDGWTKIADTTGSTQTNRPQTIFKTFHPGDFPVGSYPRPSISGTKLTQWQVNPVNHWRDATQTCSISVMTNASPPVVTPTGCTGSGPIYEGDRVTLAGNSSVANGTYTAANLQVSGAFTLIGATSSGTNASGTITAPDYGSLMTAFITYGVTISANAVVQVDYVSDSNPCHLGNQAMCDAAALTQSTMLSFNSSGWGAEIDTSANLGACAGQANARTMMGAGAWRYYLKGPLLTQAIIEDRSTALAYDFGCKDLYTTVTTQFPDITASSTTLTVADTSEFTTLGFPQTIVVQNIASVSTNNSAEIMTVTAAPTSTTLTVLRGQSGTIALTLYPGSVVRITGVSAGNANSWLERPLGQTGYTSSNPATCSQTTLSSTGTSIASNYGVTDLFSTLDTSLPYTIQVDSEQMTVASRSLRNLNGLTRGVNGPAVAHPSCSWIFAQPFISNWVTAPSNMYKSLHPVIIATFYTIGGSQWPGVDEQFILENDWFGKMQDQYYALTIKTGAGLSTNKVNGDIVPHKANTRWRRRFWDGTAPGGTDCPYGTQTGCGVAIDHNLAYMAYSQVIPNYDPVTYSEANSPTMFQTEINSLETNYCSTYPTSYLNLCPSNPARLGAAYDYTGYFAPDETQPGGRGENSPITRWGADYLYAFPVTSSAFIQNNLIAHEISESYDTVVELMDWNTRDDNTTDYFDDLNQTLAFGRVLSRDAYPTLGAPLAVSSWFISSATNYPTPVGIMTNLIGAQSRTADQWNPDTNHQGQLEVVSYLTTGDYYYLEGIQMVGSVDTRVAGVGNGATGGHNQWAIVNPEGTSTRGMAWTLRPIVMAAALSPDNSPEKRYFNQKYAYNMAVYEGSMGITTGYWNDPTSTSKWYWGHNTLNQTPSIGNPLNLFHPWGGTSTASASGSSDFVPNVAPPGNYPVSVCWEEAPWQQGFVISVLGMAHDLGLGEGEPVRQSNATYLINFVNQAASYVSTTYPSPPKLKGYLVASEYVATRTGPSSGAANCTTRSMTDATQIYISSWSEILALVCKDTTSGCAVNQDALDYGDIANNRWVGGVSANGDEQYPTIQQGVAAFYTDVDVTPCPLRVGSSTCGTSAQQWLAANVQNQQNYAGTHTWNWIPRQTYVIQGAAFGATTVFGNAQIF